MSYLQSQNAIDKKQFTTYYRTGTGSSNIIFGDNGELGNFFYASMGPQPQAWILDVVDVTMAEKPRINSIMLDSGSEYMYMGYEDLQKLMRHFIVPGCSIISSELKCACNSETNLDIYFPILHMTIGNFQQQLKIVMKPNMYFKYDGGQWCISSFREDSNLNDKNYWVMGLPFYKAFDIVHDIDNNKIGLKSYQYSGVVSLVNGAYKKAFWLSSASVVVFAVLLGV